MSLADEPLILRPGDVEPFDRGAGVKTTRLIGKWNRPGNKLTTGLTAFEAGSESAPHSHNVEESVVVLEGEATMMIGGEAHEVKAGEAAWIPAGTLHYIRNHGDGPLRIYWVYGGQEVKHSRSRPREKRLGGVGKKNAGSRPGSDDESRHS